MAPAKLSKSTKTVQRMQETAAEALQVVQHTEDSSGKPCSDVQTPQDASVEPTQDAFTERTETFQSCAEAALVKPVDSVPKEAAPVEPYKDAQLVEDVETFLIHTGDTSVELGTQKDGIMQRVKVYSMEMKDHVVEIVGSIGDRIVTIKATVYEMGSSTVGKAKQMSLTARATGADYLGKAGTTIRAKTVFLQDGYVYITSAVEGRVLYMKAKVAEPIRSCAISLHESSSKKLDHVLQKFKPLYVKTHDAITDLIGTVGDRIVAIRSRMSETSTSIKVWTLESLSGARNVLDGYASPVFNKVSALRQNVASRVDHIFISISDGAVHLKGAVAERSWPLRTALSNGWQAATKTPVAFAEKLAAIVSDAYGKCRDQLKVIQCSIKDGFLYICAKFKDRLVVIRISIAEFAEHLQSRSLNMYAATRVSLTGACSGAKSSILNATEITRTKAVEAGTNIRSLAASPDARAAAAGGLALGASGAATGFVTGGAVGAVCALPAAFFTFGLSIPVGAAVGAGAGGVLGGSAGTVAGSMAGYKAHREKEAIGTSIRGAFERARVQKVKTVDSASNLGAALAARIRGHTGGSA